MDWQSIDESAPRDRDILLAYFEPLASSPNTVELVRLTDGPYGEYCVNVSSAAMRSKAHARMTHWADPSRQTSDDDDLLTAIEEDGARLRGQQGGS